MSNFLTSIRSGWLTLWKDEKQLEKPFTLSFFLQILFIVLFYFLTYSVLFRYTMLSEQAYLKPFLYIEFLKRVATIVSLGGGLVVIILFNKRLLVPWHDFDSGLRLRNTICFLTATLALRHAFYEYNFFLDQYHLFDRGLLLVMVGLAFWRPVFVIPFLSLVLVIIGQFELLAGYSLADSLMPLQILIMFVAFFLFWLISKKFSFLNFLFMMGCVIASNYFFSGLGKVNYEWVFVDLISNILPNSYAMGWGDFLSMDTIQTLTKWMTYANIPLKMLTLGVELGMLFFFFQLTWTRMLVSAALLFHFGIFISSGICFWYWSGIHLFLLWYVWRKGTYDVERLFNVQRMLFAVLIIASANYWSRPVKLVWLSKPFNYVSYVNVETSGGEIYRLSPDFFGAYDYNFTFQKFHYMYAPKDVKRIGFGGLGSPKKIFYFFAEERTNQEIFKFENEYGSSSLNTRRKDRLTKFLTTYARNFNAKVDSKDWLSWPRPPDLLWQSRGVSQLPLGAKIQKLSLHCTTNYYSKTSGPRIIREEDISELRITDEN